MKEEFFAKGGKIKQIGRKPKRDTYQTNDLLTVYSHDWTYKVL
jgi:hypothetical protein